MSAPARSAAMPWALTGLDVREYGRIVDSRYAPRDACTRVLRPNLVIWSGEAAAPGRKVDPSAVAVLMPLTDDELALLTVRGDQAGSRGAAEQREAMRRAAARRGIDLTAEGAPQATLDWSGEATGALLDLVRVR